MNRVFLVGNLTRDPELIETSSHISVCRFTVAVNRTYSSQDGERKTDFFNVTAWRGLGENVSKYAKKGQKVAVVGSIELRNYEDAQGIRRTAVDVVANDVEFLARPSNGGDYSSIPGEGEYAPAKRTTASAEVPALQDMDDDDIPF
ncbi:MAG: single-stranded DNA-binding protein [Clostridia bacterium]|nr:single-stranded DNA-binding protein [Clostridia bacterium]